MRHPILTLTVLLALGASPALAQEPEDPEPVSPEIWTVEEYERCSTDPARNEIARGEVAGEPACSIRIVELDDGVVTWRQVLVEQATFTAEFVERLRRAPAAQRGWFFAERPPDDESDGEDD